MERASGPPAPRCLVTRFRPLGAVEDTPSQNNSYSYSCSYLLAWRARQHHSSRIVSIPPYCGSSSSSSSSSSGSSNSSSNSGNSDRGAEKAGAVARVGRAQQQQQQQKKKQSSSNRKMEAGAVLCWCLCWCRCWCCLLFLLKPMPPRAAASAINS